MSVATNRINLAAYQALFQSEVFTLVPLNISQVTRGFLSATAIASQQRFAGGQFDPAFARTPRNPRNIGVINVCPAALAAAQRH